MDRDYTFMRINLPGLSLYTKGMILLRSLLVLSPLPISLIRLSIKRMKIGDIYERIT